MSLPAYLGPPLLGRRVELTLTGGREDRGVVVAVHRSRGLLMLAPIGSREPHGAWRTQPGARRTHARESIRMLTVLDLDKTEVREEPQSKRIRPDFRHPGRPA